MKLRVEMKRIDNLFNDVICLENLYSADDKACKGKSSRRDVVEYKKNREENLILLRETLLRGEYKTSPYIKFKIFDGKEREISKLPYFPDRIVHHAICNIIEPILIKTLVTNGLCNPALKLGHFN